MAETVSVAGIPVDQETLERMFEALAERHWGGLPGTYTPRLHMLKPITGPVASYEQVLHEYMTSGSMPAWFRQRFMGEGSDTSRGDIDGAYEKVMAAAGFPRIVWAMRRPWDELPPPYLDEWSRAIRAGNAPWLLVTGGEAQDRSRILAQAAIAASTTMVGTITYRTSKTICDEVASAGNYGSNSKHNVLMPYRECGLLLIDGLGGERRKAPEARALADLLVARRDHMLPTAIATEAGLGGIVAAYKSVDERAAGEMLDAIEGGLTGYGSAMEAPGIIAL